jgi:hypothetical protein
MKVYIVVEDSHGQIGVAASRKAAKQWLVSSNWVNQHSDIWCPDGNERWGGHYITLDDLYGENWKEKFLQSSDELLENMGFFINEEELIEEEG